ncbi:MAG TPA: hypothetical protein VJ302_15390 [Blastocatellia bacterium]|nr:hypothetical protein [Blastocatellia bacterium]
MYRRYPSTLFFSSIFVGLAGMLIYGADANSSELLQLLSRQAERLKLKSTELQALVKGEIVSRSVPTSHSKEMAGFGAVLVEAEPKDFIGAFRTLAIFKQSKSLIACGRFANPPALADLAGLTVKDKELLELMRARVKDSDIKLSESDINRIRAIAGNNPGFSSRLIPKLTDEYRSILFEKVKAYSTLGGQSLGAYVDRDEPVNTHEALTRMVHFQSTYAKYGERFNTLLADQPRVGDQQMESFYYWAVQKFGQLKPIVSLIHVMIFQEDERFYIVSKQIYSSHYTEAGLLIAELNPVVDSQGKVRTLAAYTVRLQVDMFGGPMGFMKKRMAQPKMIETLNEGLQGLRANVETLSRISVQVRDK